MIGLTREQRTCRDINAADERDAPTNPVQERWGTFASHVVTGGRHDTVAMQQDAAALLAALVGPAVAVAIEADAEWR